MFFTKKKNNEIKNFIRSEIDDATRMHLSNREFMLNSYPMGKPYITTIVREIHNELFHQYGKDGNYISLRKKLEEQHYELCKKLRKTFNQEQSTLEFKIKNLENEVNRLKDIVREVTDHVYKED